MHKVLLLMLVVLANVFLFSKTSATDFITPQDDNTSGNVSLSRNFGGNLFAVGNQVDISSNVEGDVFTFGNIIDFKGIITNNLFTAGNTIDINSTVNKDVFAAGSDIKISEQAIINGNLYLGSGTAEIAGTVKGNVYSSTGTLNISGKVLGDINSRTGQISLMPTAAISGKISYTSNEDIKISSGAIYQAIEKKAIPVSNNKVKDQIFGKIFSLLMTLLVGALVIHLFGKKVKEIDKMIKDNFWGTLLGGFLSLILVPIICVILFALVIGVHLGLILLGIYSLAIYLTSIVVGLRLGNWIFREKKSPLMAMTLGLIVINMLSFIPVINGIISFLILCLGLGSIYLVSKAALTNK